MMLKQNKKNFFRSIASSRIRKAGIVGILSVVAIVLWPAGPAFAALDFDHNLTTSPWIDSSAELTSWSVTTSTAASSGSKIVLTDAWWTFLSFGDIQPTSITARGGG